MAVYTHISREELDLFTDHYSIENVLEFSGIKGGTSNSNYLPVSYTHLTLPTKA